MLSASSVRLSGFVSFPHRSRIPYYSHPLLQLARSLLAYDESIRFAFFDIKDERKPNFWASCNLQNCSCRLLKTVNTAFKESVSKGQKISKIRLSLSKKGWHYYSKIKKENHEFAWKRSFSRKIGNKLWALNVPDSGCWLKLEHVV